MNVRLFDLAQELVEPCGVGVEIKYSSAEFAENIIALTF
jgi:hypothetical protein